MTMNLDDEMRLYPTRYGPWCRDMTDEFFRGVCDHHLASNLARLDDWARHIRGGALREIRQRFAMLHWDLEVRRFNFIIEGELERERPA